MAKRGALELLSGYDSTATGSDSDSGSVCDLTGSVRDREPCRLEFSEFKSDVPIPPMKHHGAGFEMKAARGEKRDRYSMISKINAVDYARSVPLDRSGLGPGGSIGKARAARELGITDVKTLRDWEKAYEKYQAVVAEAEVLVANGGKKRKLTRTAWLA